MKTVLWALAAGVAIGLLLAPEKGAEIRRKIKNRLNDFGDAIADEADDLYADGKDALRTGRARAQDVADGIKSSANRIK